MYTLIGGPYAGEKAKLSADFNSSYTFRAKGMLGYYVTHGDGRIKWESL